MAKKPINLRIDEKLLEEFDTLQGKRTENIEKAMSLYIQSKDNVNTGEDTFVNTELIKNLRERINALERDKNYLQEKLDKMEAANEELRRSLAFEQQAHFEAQKQLPASQKKWWKFWKK